VLSGKVLQDGNPLEFFLVSGVHDKDFPWGDGEIFSDVLLVIGDGTAGYGRFAVTQRVLEGLKLNVGKGTFEYRGPIFEIPRDMPLLFQKLPARIPNSSNAWPNLI